MGKGRIALVIGLLLALIISITGCTYNKPTETNPSESYTQKTGDNTYIDTRQFNILSSEENKDLETIITTYARGKGYNVNVDYAGTLEIMEKLNEKQKYDAIWVANSIWTYMIETDKVSISNSKSTSITPIVFGIKKSKAESLGFVGKTIYTKDILDAISAGDLKFAMSNPNTTNSGASAYLGMLYTFAGNPEVLTEEILSRTEVKSKMKTFFSGLERTSGTEDFLEELFLNGDYDAVYSYESSIININKKLEAQGRETLYVIYPMDGVPISDNPFAYVDNKDDKKLNVFTDIQNYLLSAEGKRLLQEKGRRTWYGGTNSNVDRTIFNDSWGINTTEYINPVKYPTAEVIKKALVFYQSQYRKPIHVVFCLDYSGSMRGEGQEELTNAMEYILSDKALADNIQFSDEDIIDVLGFSNEVTVIGKTNDGTDTEKILDAIKERTAYGGTAIYKASTKALDILSGEDSLRNLSIILMTDGEGNIGRFIDLKNKYNALKKDIPIYSIMFGEANSEQLQEIADLTNGKVFDGKTDLVKAFKEVRGYN